MFKSLVSIVLAVVVISGSSATVIADRRDAEEEFWNSLSNEYYYDRMSVKEKYYYDRLDAACMDYLLGDDRYLSETEGVYERDEDGYYNIIVDIDGYFDLFPSDIASIETVMDIPDIFLWSNPQYFFIDRIETAGFEYCIRIRSEFDDPEERKKAADQIKELVNEYKALVPENALPEEKEKIIHDEMCKRIDYVMWELDQSIYSAVLGKTVCAGYCKLFSALMNSLGVNCLEVIGEDHAWNLIELHGFWYMVDVTNSDQIGFINYWVYNTASILFNLDGDIFGRFVPEIKYDNVYVPNDLTGYSSPYFVVDGRRFFIVNAVEEGYGLLAFCLDANKPETDSVRYNGKDYRLITKPQETKPFAQDYGCASFVERIYKNILGREADKNGLYYWTYDLYSFNHTGAEVAQNFLFSPEFEARNTGNEEFVNILYRTFFGREPENDGVKFWVSQLDSGSMDRVSVANGFIYSQEWADTCASYGISSDGAVAPSIETAPSYLTLDFVERLYTTALERASDEEGKNYWANELANFRFTGEQVGVMFFLSDEMASSGLSDSEFVERMYMTFMDRSPDEEGFDFWVKFIADGGSRESAVLGFTRSLEFVDKCVDARIKPY